MPFREAPGPAASRASFGAVSEPIEPSRSLAAGCAFATFELTAYLLAALRALNGEHPNRGLSMCHVALSCAVSSCVAQRPVRLSYSEVRRQVCSS